MKARLLIRKDFPLMDAGTPVASIRSALQDAPVVVVTDGEGYRGLLTHADIAEHDDDDSAVGRPAPRPSIDADEEIGEVLETMRSAGRTVLPVFESGRFAGLVHEVDITDALLQYRSELEREAQRHTAQITAVNNALQSEIEERRRTEEALRESERRYRELADLVPQAVFETDLSGTFTFANKTAFELFGYHPGDLARGVNVTECVVPEDRPRARDNLQRRLRGEGPDNTQYTARRKDGRTFPVIIRSAVIRHGEQVVGFRGAVIDIAEIQRMERELAEERLRAQKLESIGVLAAGIAHDFNNILAAVLGNITLAGREAEGNEALREILTEAERAALQAAELTNQLGTFAKGGAPVTRPTSLAELIRRSAGFVQHGSPTKCVFEIPDGLWPAEVDSRQINQVVSNLVINANQAMPKGGEIVVGATNESLSCPVPLGLAPGRYVRLWVADGGEGIRPEHLGKIYDPYFTTKRSGSGLGLAVCHSIVKRHRGAIDVRSERGKGTRFDVYLPASDRTPTAEKPTDGAQTEPGTGRILLMDDQASLRRVGALMLERLGFEADCAEDGTAAVAMYRKAMEEGRAYRAVLLDLTVPGGLGGRETLDRLLALDPHVKAIASSGYSGTLTLGECRAHGFAAVLPKPYTLAELGKAMAAVLPRQTAE